jgi:hypothetical protein
VLTSNRAAGKILAITQDVIAQRPYHYVCEYITWGRCSLRQWLNGEFYGQLPLMIQGATVSAHNENPQNSRYGTYGGDATLDKVFLLSMDEVHRYFEGDNDRIARFQGSGAWWWLRSPGSHADRAANVDVTDAGSVVFGGRVSPTGGRVDIGCGGVRPALWLNL